MRHHAFPSALADLNPLNPQSFFLTKGSTDQPLSKIVKGQFNWFHPKFDLLKVVDVSSQPWKPPCQDHELKEVKEG